MVLSPCKFWRMSARVINSVGNGGPPPRARLGRGTAWSISAASALKSMCFSISYSTSPSPASRSWAASGLSLTMVVQARSSGPVLSHDPGFSRPPIAGRDSSWIFSAFCAANVSGHRDNLRRRPVTPSPPLLWTLPWPSPKATRGRTLRGTGNRLRQQWP